MIVAGFGNTSEDVVRLVMALAPVIETITA